jgi:REP element-mobilizing transposase RayT
VFGPATKTTEKRSLARLPFDPALRTEMRGALQYPAVRFTRRQIECIASGFAETVEQFRIILYACAILWDHVHIVVARQNQSIESVARILKSAATRRLTSEGLHPLSRFADSSGRAPMPWAKAGWERYLDRGVEIVETSKYVNRNPEKHGLPAQQWEFVKPYSCRV